MSEEARLVPAFLTDLVIRQIDDSTWELFSPLKYQSALLVAIITVPFEFRTDFASVPRIPFIFDVLGDIAHEPAVVHDWLYYIGIYGRAMSDKIFLEAMEANGVSFYKRWQIYFGVRIGGWWAWGEHRKAGNSSADFPKTHPQAPPKSS